MPGLVVADERRRRLPALVRALAEGADRWDWARLTLAGGDGWLDPGWLPAAPRPTGVLHHQTRACVVMPLAASWDEQRAGLGRNLRESLRRSRNRLDGSGAAWRVRTVLPGPGWSAAVASLCRLHAQRAAVKGRPRHIDWSADRAVARLIADVGVRLPGGAIEIMFLDIGGAPAAAQAVLRGGGTTYLLMSGFDPRWWWHGPMTELVGAAVRAAIARGDRRLNLSSGPIASKTRWSRDLELHQDFVLVGARGRSRAAYAGYASLEAVHRFRRESRRSRPTGAPQAV
jgi:CelD/BcsL family acetyltransferase involved in cellulose biosynthesis